MITTISLSFLLVFATSNPTFPLFPSISTYFIQEDADFAEGLKAFQAGDYQKAIESFSRFAERKPKEFNAHYHLGLCYRALKRYAEAIAAFEKAARLKSKPPLAQFELGKTHLEMKNYEAAAKQYKWLQKENSSLATEMRNLIPEEVVKQYKLALSQEEIALADLKAAEPILPLSANLRPTILYRERAGYTDLARSNKVNGTVILSVVYSKEGKIVGIQVVRALPDGLTENAIQAAKKIRFKPALKDGQPVSVRGNVEFNFSTE